MSDTPLPLTGLPASGAVTIGFLTIAQDSNGSLGGYLLTNSWGRPLEFRLTTAVQPNRVQQILYGPTLTEYLHADLIGKSLIEKTGSPPALIVTDSLSALALRSRLGILTLGVMPEPFVCPPDLQVLRHPRSSALLVFPRRFSAEEPEMIERLELIDPAVDLAEPFTRIREAIAEARKMGVAGRAA